MATRAALAPPQRNGVTPAAKRQSALRIWLDERIERGKAKVFSERVSVTPEFARMILEERNKDNRRINSMKLEQIKSDMSAGRFLLNGETIIFAKTGDLNDGQHRLLGVAETNKPHDMIFLFGVDRETRDTVDTGKARTVGDHLGMSGWPYATQIASLARRSIAFERTNKESLGRSSNISSSEIIERVNNDKFMGEAAAFATNNAVKYRAMCGSGDVAFAYYQLGLKKPDQAKTFMEKLRDGANMGEQDPIFAARQYLMTRPKLTAGNKIEIIFRAWNYWIKDEKVQSLRVRGSIPAIEG